MSQTVGWIKAIKNILIELRNRWMWLCLVLAIAVSRICWYGIQQAYVIYPDSTQYIAFDTSAVLQGNLRAAEGRPPVYGIFLDFMQLFFGEGYLEATKIVQVLVSILSLYIFFKLLGRIGIGTPWREICVFLYGVTPAVVGWENAILTESFSISGSKFFLYGVVIYIQ